MTTESTSTVSTTNSDQRTPAVDITLAQQSVCMVARRPVSVGITIANTSDQPLDLSLRMRGRLAALATIDPDRLRLEPHDEAEAEVTFHPAHGPHVPTGPMPYAIAATSDTGELLTVVFGLVDLHEQRPGRPFGIGTPCIRAE